MNVDALHAALIFLPPEFPAPWASGWGVDAYGLWMGLTVGGVRQAFRWIPPGGFRMGSPPEETERGEDETPHQVELTQGFWLADTACTQALWEAVMGENPSEYQGAQRPVEHVSWEQVSSFLDRINAWIKGLGLRLPTEAEWEYACRAGSPTPFWFGENITTEQVNYNGNYPYAGDKQGEYREQTVEVKALPCNGWGLYQMHGNVYEWCRDWYGEYPKGSVTDPQGPVWRGRRVLRGGSWSGNARFARSAQRYLYSPGSRYRNIGFRLARGQ